MAFTTKALRAITSLAVAVTIGLAPHRAHALRYYDGEITPAVIITGITADDGQPAGGINDNEDWVVVRKYGIELGIRGRKCYEAKDDDSSTCPSNDYPTNKDGTFNFEAGSIPDSASYCPSDYGFYDGAQGGPTWCIDYSINVNYDDGGGEEAEDRGRGRKLWSMEEPKVLTDFVYQLSLDADPSCTTNSSTWDPINDALDGTTCLDAFYMGDNDTPSGDGIEVLCWDDIAYTGNVTKSSVAQQTINYVLLTDSVGYPMIDPDPVRETFKPDTTPATYSITLKAYCRDDDYDCKMRNGSGGKTRSTGTTKNSGGMKDSKGGNTNAGDGEKRSKSGKNGESSAAVRGQRMIHFITYDRIYVHVLFHLLHSILNSTTFSFI